jgi:hypothetical protein
VWRVAVALPHTGARPLPLFPRASIFLASQAVRAKKRFQLGLCSCLTLAHSPLDALLQLVERNVQPESPAHRRRP